MDNLIPLKNYSPDEMAMAETVVIKKLVNKHGFQKIVKLIGLLFSEACRLQGISDYTKSIYIKQLIEDFKEGCNYE